MSRCVSWVITPVLMVLGVRAHSGAGCMRSAANADRGGLQWRTELGKVLLLVAHTCDAREAVGVVLDCLTQDGLLSPVNEIRYMTLSVMVDVTKHAGAAIRCVTNSILFAGTLCALLIVPSV